MNTVNLFNRTPSSLKHFLLLHFLLISAFTFSSVNGTAQPAFDLRAKQKYSQYDLSAEKINKVNYYYRNSFEVKQGEKQCPSCPDLSEDMLDVSSLENLRMDRNIVTFLTEPGFPVILKSFDDLILGYGTHSGLQRSSVYNTETILLDQSTRLSISNTDGSYVNDQYRRIRYQAEYGKGVKLHFNRFQTEAGFDFLRIYDGEGSTARLLGIFSGNKLPPDVHSSSRVLVVEFFTDEAVTYSGVDAEVVPVAPFILPPPNNQDCQGAIPVCQTFYSQPVSYSGTGNVPNEINTSINCLLSGEKNDVWYQFTVQTSGTLCFSITPNNFSEDYDWAVYNLTNANCSDIYNNASLQVSCNYSGIGGVTGANGQSGSQNNPCINVTAGQSFVLNVSNFSSSQNGYVLDFSQSTAQLFDNVPPQIQSVVTPVCGATSLTFNFSENVLCSTVSPADFSLNGPGGPYTVTSVTGPGCAAGATNENTFTVTLSQPVSAPGSYSICLNNTAGSVTDMCSNVAPPGCLTFNIAEITAGFAPVTTQCLTGNSFSFTNTSSSTATGTMTYSWNFPGASPSSSTAVNPSGITWPAAGNYTVTLTATQGTCSDTFSRTVSVLLPATAGTAAVSPAFICAGTCTNLTLTGYQGGIQWQSASSAAGPYTNIPGGTTTPFQVCPTGITYYRAVVSGCSNATTNYVQVSVNPSPNVQIANNHITICPGGSATLNASGAAIYTWNPGPSSGANLNVSPSATTTYTVTGTTSGCRDTAMAIVTVNQVPVVNAGSDITMCQGESTTLTATGAGSYSWSPATGLSSSTGSTVLASPSSTITYTVTGTSGTNCYSYDTVIVNVSPPPVADAGSDLQVCEGSSATLNAQGGTFFEWSPSSSLSAPTGAIVTATPLSTTTYTVTASIGSCTSTDHVIVSVVPMPVADAGSDVTICEGTSTGLSATGGTTFSWSPQTGLSATQGPSVIASPLSTTTYTVTASNSDCISTDEVIVTVDPSPVTNAGADEFICINQNVALTATGASSYVWSPANGLSNTSGSSVVASPLVTTTYTVTGTINNCTSTDEVIVHVQNGITLSVTADQDICANDTVQLTVTGANSYAWSPNSGLSSLTDSIVTASPLATTTYTVSGTSNGCYGSEDVIVTVHPDPIVSAGGDETICFGSVVQLNASGAISYSWYPGGGLSDPNIANPSASPLATTTYTVTGTSAAGCAASDTIIVFVNNIPVADFSVVENCVYSPLVFTDQTTIPGGNISSWFWDFGDNTTSMQANPVHQYNAPGQYTVTLVVQSDAIPACASVVTKTVTVYPKPEAAFSTTTVCEGLVTTFSNNSSVSSGSYTSSWNFGDGASSNDDSPNHAYSSDGTYSAELIIVSDHNCADTITAGVTVFDKPAAQFITDSVCLGYQTTFTDQSMSSSTISGYEWSTGDGTMYSGANAIHSYMTSGSFSSTLIITTTEGCKDTVTREVIVYAKPEASFTVEPVCFGSQSVFVNNSSVDSPDAITVINWSFGDGATSGISSPVHQYNAVGTYNSELIIATTHGCTDTITQVVSVHAAPEARIWSAVKDGCDPVCIDFRDSSVSALPITDWKWNFADGSSGSELQNPDHCFGNGTYGVTLIVTTASGCSDTSEAYEVISHAVPVADFTFTPLEPSILDPKVIFTDASVNASEWYWSFGDSATAVYNSVLDQIEHLYPDTGVYCANLKVKSSHGCLDSITQCLRIAPDHVIYAPNAFTPNGDGKNDIFSIIGSGINERGFEFRIYDRWGNLTFYATDIKTGWNGKFNNNGNPVPEDTYVYVVEYRDMQNVPKRIAGKVSVLR